MIPGRTVPSSKIRTPTQNLVAMPDQGATPVQRLEMAAIKTLPRKAIRGQDQHLLDVKEDLWINASRTARLRAMQNVSQAVDKIAEERNPNPKMKFYFHFRDTNTSHNTNMYFIPEKVLF